MERHSQHTRHDPNPTQELSRRLAGLGLRTTGPRMEVYRVIQESKDHPTADAIFQRVRKLAPRVSLATVYNCLEALTRAGLVRIMNEPAGAARYDACTHRHHHLICRRCGQVVDLHDPDLDRLVPKEAEGFQVEDLSVHFYGTCGACRGMVGESRSAPPDG